MITTGDFMRLPLGELSYTSITLDPSQQKQKQINVWDSYRLPMALLGLNVPLLLEQGYEKLRALNISAQRGYTRKMDDVSLGDTDEEETDDDEEVSKIAISTDIWSYHPQTTFITPHLNIKGVEYYPTIMAAGRGVYAVMNYTAFLRFRNQSIPGRLKFASFRKVH